MQYDIRNNLGEYLYFEKPGAVPMVNEISPELPAAAVYDPYVTIAGVVVPKLVLWAIGGGLVLSYLKGK